MRFRLEVQVVKEEHGYEDIVMEKTTVVNISNPPEAHRLFEAAAKAIRDKIREGDIS